MKTLFTIAFLLGTRFLFSQSLTFHDYRELAINGDSIDLSVFAGKKVLVVNIASQCGFTPQLGPLQKLDSLYESYGFEVLGFPSNNFANQEPLPDSSIEDFCQNNYNVQFQLMHKIDIVSGDTAPVYKWLQRKALNGVANASVTWNFNKFLIDRQGKWVRRFTQATNPLDTAITNWIMRPEVTGTKEELSHNAFSLVGNPVVTGADIVCESAEATPPAHVGVTDAMGRPKKIEWRKVGNRLVITPAHLRPAVYWLTIRTASHSHVLKVLVEK